MGSICAGDSSSHDNHSVSLSQIKVKFVNQLPTILDSLIVITNGVMDFDPFEERLQSKQIKDKYVIQSGIIKPGTIAQLKINRQGIKQVIYTTLPEQTNALMDYKIHQSLTKSLQKAFQFQNTKVGIALPKFSDLKINQKSYQQKLINALRLFSFKGKKGSLYLQVQQKSQRALIIEMKKNPFQEGECQQE